MAVKTKEYEELLAKLDGRSVSWWASKYLPGMSYSTLSQQLNGYISTMSDEVKNAIKEFIDSQEVSANKVQ